MTNTQQFFKGLAMALVGVVVAAFSTTPIDFLLLAVTAVCTILVYTGKNLISLFHSDSPAGSLSFVNLISALLVAIGTGVLEAAGLFIIEGAVNWSILGKVVLSVTFTYLGGTWFAGPYSTEKKRLFASKTYIRSMGYAKKTALAIILFLGLSAGLSAQKGVVVLGHVSQKTVEKGLLDNGSLMLSFDAVIQGPTYVFGDPDAQIKVIQGYGIAVGYKHILPDLTSDYGVSLGVIHKVMTEEGESQKIGIALLPNYYNFMAGPIWFVGDKYPGVMVGGFITF